MRCSIIRLRCPLSRCLPASTERFQSTTRRNGGPARNADTRKSPDYSLDRQLRLGTLEQKLWPGTVIFLRWRSIAREDIPRTLRVRSLAYFAIEEDVRTLFEESGLKV
jgi:hypothetical protein